MAVAPEDSGARLYPGARNPGFAPSSYAANWSASTRSSFALPRCSAARWSLSASCVEPVINGPQQLRELVAGGERQRLRRSERGAHGRKCGSSGTWRGKVAPVCGNRPLARSAGADVPQTIRGVAAPQIERTGFCC
jgi:hypothetical protein